MHIAEKCSGLDSSCYSAIKDIKNVWITYKACSNINFSDIIKRIEDLEKVCKNKLTYSNVVNTNLVNVPNSNNVNSKGNSTASVNNGIVKNDIEQLQRKIRSKNIIGGRRFYGG